MEPLVATGRDVSPLFGLTGACFRFSSATETTLVNSSAGNEDNAEISSYCESMLLYWARAYVERGVGAGAHARLAWDSFQTSMRAPEWRLSTSKMRIRAGPQEPSAILCLKTVVLLSS